MKFSDKLREARKQANMSQEALAEKLGVSRQAVTKWETDKGIPDISNLLEISALFGISVEGLLSGEEGIAAKQNALYESVTEYDMDGEKRIDLKLGGAKKVVLMGTDDEKIRVRLLSRTIETIKQDFKTRIEDEKHRIDVEIHRSAQITEADAKERLEIEVYLPNRYLNRVEMNVNCAELQLSKIVCDNLEFNGRADHLTADRVEAIVEVNCNLDMEIVCRGLVGSFELNQISATSVLTVQNDFAFRTVVKGISNSVSYRIGEEPAEDFSDPEAETCIELNGMKSELKIVRA